MTTYSGMSFDMDGDNSVIINTLSQSGRISLSDITAATIGNLSEAAQWEDDGEVAVTTDHQTRETCTPVLRPWEDNSSKLQQSTHNASENEIVLSSDKPAPTTYCESHSTKRKLEDSDDYIEEAAAHSQKWQRLDGYLKIQPLNYDKPQFQDQTVQAPTLQEQLQDPISQTQPEQQISKTTYAGQSFNPISDPHPEHTTLTAPQQSQGHIHGNQQGQQIYPTPRHAWNLPHSSMESIPQNRPPNHGTHNIPRQLQQSVLLTRRGQQGNSHAIPRQPHCSTLQNGHGQSTQDVLTVARLPPKPVDLPRPVPQQDQGLLMVPKQPHQALATGTPTLRPQQDQGLLTFPRQQKPQVIGIPPTLRHQLSESTSVAMGEFLSSLQQASLYTPVARSAVATTLASVCSTGNNQGTASAMSSPYAQQQGRAASIAQSQLSPNQGTQFTPHRIQETQSMIQGTTPIPTAPSTQNYLPWTYRQPMQQSTSTFQPMATQPLSGYTTPVSSQPRETLDYKPAVAYPASFSPISPYQPTLGPSSVYQAPFVPQPSPVLVKSDNQHLEQMKFEPVTPVSKGAKNIGHYDNSPAMESRFTESLSNLIGSPASESPSASNNSMFSDLQRILTNECKKENVPQTLFGIDPKQVNEPKKENVFTRERDLQERFSLLQNSHSQEIHQLSSVFRYQSALIETERFRTLHECQYPENYKASVNLYYDEKLHKVMDRVTRSVSLLENAKETKQKEKVTKPRPHLSKSAVRLMEKWYGENTEHPYPDNTNIEYLAQAGNIGVEQVKKWFANKRNRTQNTRSLTEIAIQKRKLGKLSNKLSYELGD